VARRYYLDDYTTDATVDTTRKAVLQEGRADVDVAIGALAHATWMQKGEVHPTVAIGAALSPFDERMRYLAGGGIVIGRQRQIALTGGVAFGRLPTLSRFVRTDGESGRQYVPIATESVPTVNRWKTSWYVGVSYNLAQTKKF
jgi:hypothetical protein